MSKKKWDKPDLAGVQNPHSKMYIQVMHKGFEHVTLTKDEAIQLLTYIRELESDIWEEVGRLNQNND